MGNKKEELIIKYSKHLREKFEVDVESDLLERIVHGLGPSIYNRDAATVSGSSESELLRVKTNFLIKKLGLEDSDALMGAINKVMAKYGRSERTKYRAVVYYMLVKAFGKEEVYD
jgi:hypothetical protein